MARGLASSCPQCGAPLRFEGAASLTTICKYCRAGVTRSGVDLETLGKVPDLVATDTRLALGMSGSLESKGFVVLGRLQLDQGEGAWDEWYLGYADGRFGWLAEARGRLLCTIKHEKPLALPAFESITPGTRLALEGIGELAVSEVGKGRFVSAEGELPFTADLGASYRFVDASGEHGEFATLDYGVDSGDEPLIFVGRELDWAAARLSGAAPEVAGAAPSAALACPSCGAPVSPKLAETKVLTCTSCHAVLDLSQGPLQMLASMAKRPRPGIPLGSKGTLGGEELEVIGYVRRCVPVDGQEYGWNEYLLHGPKGYRWLAESDGHFSLLKEIPAGRVKNVELGVGADCDKRHFKHFQTAKARYLEVQGEFYWRLDSRSRVDMDDYVSPPYLLSCERGAGEHNWSLGEYTSGEDVWAGLKLAQKPPPVRGVGPAQPNPFVAKSWMARAICVIALVALAVIGQAAVKLHPEKQVLSVDVPLGPAGTVTISDPFDIPGAPQAVEISGRADVSNAWVGLDLALIEEASGDAELAGLELSYYSGVEDGESWSEGRNSGSVIVSAVKPGRYVLRVEPVSGQDVNGSLPEMAHVVVTRGVFLVPPAVLAFLGIVLYPLFLWARSKSFEVSRWSESDHPIQSGGSSDEDDE